jgi:hypothetical protein
VVPSREMWSPGFSGIRAVTPGACAGSANARSIGKAYRLSGMAMMGPGWRRAPAHHFLPTGEDVRARQNVPRGKFESARR